MLEGGVSYETEGAVARITLARPEASNAVDLAASRAFGKAVDRASADEVQAVLISGEGKRFCVGGDVVSMAAAENRSAYLFALATDFGEGLERLAGLRKPVVSAVHGAVAGAGLGVVLSSDVVVAERSTKLLMAYSGVGLTPDCGVSYLLPRCVGQQRALELALTGRVLTADEAMQWGLVAEVVDDGSCVDRGLELARRLAAGPGFALGEAKRLIRSSWAVPRARSATDEADTIAHAVAHGDATALIDGFVAGPVRPSAR